MKVMKYNVKNIKISEDGKPKRCVAKVVTVKDCEKAYLVGRAELHASIVC